MEKKKKGGARTHKTLRRVLASLLIISFLIVLSAYFFMKSTYPAPLITYAARRATGMDVELRSLTTGPWLRFTLNGLKLARGNDTVLYTDRLEIVITLRGLVNGRFVNISAGKPVIFLSALSTSTPSVPSGTGPSSEIEGPLLSIPWFFNELKVSDGLVRQHGGDSPVIAGPLNLRITAKPGRRAGVHAEAYLPLLKTSASIHGEVDIKKLGLHKGHMSLGLIKLEDMDAGGLPIIRGGSGTVKVDFTLERKNSRLRAAVKGEFKDITLPVLPDASPSSGKLTGSVAVNEALTGAELRAGLFLKEPGAGKAAYRAVLIKGAYDIKQKTLKITKAALTIPSFGSLHLIGTLHGLPDRPVSMEVHLKAERVSLALLNKTVLKPLSMEIIGPESGGGLSGTANLRGQLGEGLDWDIDLNLANSLRYGQYGLNLQDNPLTISSKGFYSPHDDSLKIGFLRAETGFGSPLTLKGMVRGLVSGTPLMDLRLRGSAIDLARSMAELSGPLLSTLELKGELAALLSIKGGLASPRIRGELTFEDTTFIGSGMAVKGMETRLALFYDKAGLSMEGVSLKAGSMGLKGFGPEAKLLKAGLTIGSITYDGKVIKAGDIHLKGDKAFLVSPAPGGGSGGKAWEGPLPRLRGTGLTISSVTYDGKLVRARGVKLKADKAFFKGSSSSAGVLPKFLKTGFEVASITYDGALVKAGGVNLKVSKAIFLKAGKPSFEERNLTLSGAFTGDIVKNLFKAPRLDFSAGEGTEGWSGGLGGLRGEASGVTLEMAGPVRVRAHIGIHGLDVERLRALSAEFTGIGADGEASGAIETGFKVNVLMGEKTTRVKAGFKLAMKDGAFASADGSVAGEGLRLKAEGNLNLLLPSMKAAYSMKVTASDFEILAGSFYGSFKDRPIEIISRGSYDPDKDELNVPLLTMSLNPVATLKMAARLSALSTEPRFDATIGPLEISNHELYDLFLRDTLGESMPLLAGLDVTGRTRLTMGAEGTFQDMTLKGELRLEDAAISSSDGELSVKGVELRLPVKLHYPEAQGRGGVRAFGSLKASKISLGPLSIPSLKASPAIAGNALTFSDDINIPVFGGTVTLGEIVLKDILSPNRELGLNMEVAGIDLKKVSTALGLPPFGGSVSGSVPGVRLLAGNLTTEGEIKLRLFGGALRLTHMAVGEVFSPVPSFKSSIEISEIDLGKLTSAFEFGSITGVLQGRIDDLVIVKGQPESFFIDIKTVKRAGVGQRINTKALENVSILGTGAAASVLNKGIYRLFDEYRYSKMGFTGQLKNDELLLLGIETEGDKGYIIKGATLPPKVEVVSYTQRISFKEMMKRLNRVDLSATGDVVVK